MNNSKGIKVILVVVFELNLKQEASLLSMVSGINKVLTNTLDPVPT